MAVTVATRASAAPKAAQSVAQTASAAAPASASIGAVHSSGPIVRMPVAQARLNVGQAGDRYEREADRMSEHVSAGTRAPPVSRITPGSLGAQRDAEEHEEDAPDANDESAQAKCENCDEAPAQKKEDEAQAKCTACDAETPAQKMDDDAQAKCADCDSGNVAQTQPATTSLIQREPDSDQPTTLESEPTEDTEDTEVPPHPDDADLTAPDCDGGGGGGAAGAPATSAPTASTDSGSESEEGSEGGDSGSEAAPAGTAETAGGAGSLDCGATESAGGGDEAEAEPEAEPEAESTSGGGAAPSCGAPAPDGGGGEGEEAADAAPEGTGDASALPVIAAPPACGDPVNENEPDPAEFSETPPGGGAEAEPAAPPAAHAPSGPCGAAAAQRKENEPEREIPARETSGPEERAPSEPRRTTPATSPVAKTLDRTETASAHIKARGTGDALPGGVRSRIEASMGVDLAGVRVHTDGNAQAASKSLRAKAFTHQNHIFIGAGNSPHDVGLMAHETTHVLQQGAIARKPVEAAKAAPAPGREVDSPARETERSAAGPAEARAAPAGREPLTPATAAKAAPVERPLPHAASSSAAMKPATPDAKPPVTPAREAIKGPVDHSKKADTPDATVTPPVPPGIVAKAVERENAKQSARAAAPSPSPAASPSPSKGLAEKPAAATEKSPGVTPAEPAVKSAAESPPVVEAEAPAPESDPRFQGTIKRLHSAARRERDHVPPQDKVDDAKAAVKAPEEEPQSHAANDNVTAMAAGAEAAPVPKEKSFEDTLNEKLESIRPKNMEQTLEFKGSGAAGKLKQAVGTQIKAQKDTTVGPLQKATVAPLPVGKYPNPKEKKLEPDAADPAQRSLHAEDVLPEPKAEAEVSVDKNKDEVDRLMKENDLDEEQLKRANEPQFTAVIEAKQKLDENTAKVVPAYRQEEAKMLTTGAKEVARASAGVLGGMRGKRKGSKDKVLSAQDAARKKEEEERKTVVGNVNSKFAATQSAVKARLDSLDGPVGTLFDVAELVARMRFENKVDELMSAYKDDRYSGVRGKLRWGWDKLTGMPKEVDQFYVEGTKVYIASMKEAFHTIAKFVDGQLAQAKKDIAEGKKKINEYLAGLKGKQKEWGDEAFKGIEGDFEALESSVEEKKQGLASELVEKYKKSRAALDERIEELKAENASLFDKVVAFIKKVVAVLKKLMDLAKLLMKVGGAVLRGIVKDPSGFLGNLVDAVKSGFSLFGEHIGKHLKDALIGFVTGSMKDVGVSSSGESGPGGVGGIILQVLGLAPHQMKEKVAAKLGVRDPTVLEKAWTKVKTLFADGASALWGKIKETAGDIREKVESEMKEWIGFQIVKAGLKWIVSLFSPVSALLRAIKMIYDVMNFFVTNLDRIIDLVNGVLTSINAVVAGNIAAAAKFIENAAAKGLSLLLGFLASLLGLSGVGAKMQSIVQRVRTVVDRAVDRVLNVILAPFRWIARKAAPLVARGKAAAKRAGAKVKTVAGKVGRFLFPQRTFTAEDESHRLFFEGEGASAELMMASRKTQMRTLVKQLRKKPENKKGAGMAALDAVIKQQDRIDQAKNDGNLTPKKLKSITTSALAIIANKMKFVIMNGKFATRKNPLLVDWPKRASAKYESVYLGPRMPEGKRVEQEKDLKDAKNSTKKKQALFSKLQDRILKAGLSDKDLVQWEADGMPITEYKPHGHTQIPGSTESLGIDSDWRTHVGRKIQIPAQKPPKSPGGKKINSELRAFGYYAGLEEKDGDHVTEIQVGGIDDLKNLWPLAADENRSAGGKLADASFEFADGVTIKMPELKARARTGPNPPQVWLKIRSTK